MDIYFQLLGVIVIQVSICVFLYWIYNNTSFKKIDYVVRETIIGIAFGVLSIIGNELGVFNGTATISLRDAPPAMAGLFFSAPSAIIAGVIGALERFFLGKGDITRIACSLATFFAGIVSAIVKRIIFKDDNDEKKSIFYGIILIIAIESVHMSIIFISMTYNVQTALEIIKTVVTPMTFMNSIGVVLAIFIIDTLFIKKKSNTKIQTIDMTFRKIIFVCITIALVVTTGFIDSVETGIYNVNTNKNLKTVLSDVRLDVEYYVNTSTISDAEIIKSVLLSSNSIDNKKLIEIAKDFKCTELSLINSKGIIYESNIPDYYDFDMKIGEQSREFVDAFNNGADTYVQDFMNQSKNEGIQRKYVAVRYNDDEFLQVGYNKTQYYDLIEESISGLGINRHIGENGYVIICDEGGHIVSTCESELIGQYVSSIGLNMKAGDNEDYTISNDNINGVDCYVMNAYTYGYYIFAIIPEAEAIYGRDVTIYINAFIEIIVFYILFLVIFKMIKKNITMNIKTVNNTLSKITGGDLNAVVKVRDNEEFASLSDDINFTVATLKRSIEEADKRIDNELNFAKSIQASALPRNFSIAKNRNLNIYAIMATAKEVGGDFYDFFFIDNRHFMVLIADVSGKGVPAAMFMMQAKAEIQTLTEQGLPVNEVFEKANNQLCSMNDSGMFVTAWLGVIDTETGLMKYTNAGHNPPLLKKNGVYNYLNTKPSLVLAGLKDVKYRVNEIQFEPTDKLFLYTDGITESINKQEELYGELRLQKCLNDNKDLLVEDTCYAVLEDLVIHCDGADQFDDITMLCIEYLNKSKELVIKNKLEEQNKVLEFIEGELIANNCSPKVLSQINVAVDEIASNIINYAYKGEGEIKIKISINGGMATIIFIDSGYAYNPLEHDDPDITLKAEERDVGGLGILIVKKTMDEVTYARLNNKNVLTIIKKIGG